MRDALRDGTGAIFRCSKGNSPGGCSRKGVRGELKPDPLEMDCLDMEADADCGGWRSDLKAVPDAEPGVDNGEFSVGNEAFRL